MTFTSTSGQTCPATWDNPILLREGTLPDPHVDPAWGYPTVFRDRESGVWRCVYQGQTANGRFVPVVARAMMACNGSCPIWPR